MTVKHSDFESLHGPLVAPPAAHEDAGPCRDMSDHDHALGTFTPLCADCGIRLDCIHGAESARDCAEACVRADDPEACQVHDRSEHLREAADLRRAERRIG